jgi:predicted nuclease of predicted toxin-antitoxin system
VKFLVDAQLPARWQGSSTSTATTPPTHPNCRTATVRPTTRSPPPQTPKTGSSSARTGTSATATSSRAPRRLLVVHTGNISNDDLLALFEANIDLIAEALDEAPLTIVGPKSFSIHPSQSPE